MVKDKKNIRFLSLGEIKNFFLEHNEKSFRAKQVYDWIWKKHVSSFEEMRNVSKAMINLLNENFFLEKISIFKEQKSSDGTIKVAFKLNDNEIIEGVLIPTTNRVTACISTQVGCSLACAFCATGKLGFTRNLTFDEIFDQVAILTKLSEENYGQSLSNIVYMGMGEPLLNYQNVIQSVEKITSENGMAMSPYRITISTVGISKMIKKLGDDKVKFNLALSLHAATDSKRRSVMPINEYNSIDTLIEALKYFYEKTKTRITIEYLLLHNFNDNIDDAKELCRFCKNFPVKINLIEYNPVEKSDFQKSGEQKTMDFIEYLESKNLIVNLRRSRGKDIDAACGQLANKSK